MNSWPSTVFGPPEPGLRLEAADAIDEVVHLLEAAAVEHERAGRHALASSHRQRAEGLAIDRWS